MALWGAYETDESKPKFLTAEQKKNTFATDRGWVYKHPNGDEEVIVAIGELAGTSGTTRLGEATITAVSFTTTAFSAAAGGDIDIEVVYNEKVDVDTAGGTPTIAITNDQTGGGTAASISAAYASGTGTNRLTFTATIGAAAGDVADTDILTIADQSIALNSGTIVDSASTSVNSEVAFTGAGAPLTVAA